MKSRLNLRILIFAGILFLTLIACSLPFITTPGKPVPTKTPGEPSVIPTTEISPGKPTVPPTTKVSSNESTVPPTEPLPPLPDFDQVLTFGGGGAEWGCYEYPRGPNSISVSVTFGLTATLCIVLSDVDVSQPIQIELVQTETMRLNSGNLALDLNTMEVQWQENPSNSGVIDKWTNDGLLYIALPIWWPIIHSPGTWRITVFQQGRSMASTDFVVDKAVGHPYINALDSRSKNEIVPAGDVLHGIHWISPNVHGNIEVVGIDFPPNSPIYVLLYLDEDGISLVQQQVVYSDSTGSIATELYGPFESSPQYSSSYLLYGITDPNTILDGEEYVICYGAIAESYGAACHYFKIESSTLNPPSPVSCPGAPPQRMVLNQRGYVCTQEDSVRLRDAPARSASTIVQLPTGSQFTVMDGPSCADNWSWWLIQTDDGYVGWIAEGGDNVDPYFICPLP